MKKCRRCSKPATLHITELREGDVHELHLCETCYHEYLDYSESATPEEKSTEISIEITGDQSLEEIDQLLCSKCGISFREFRSQGRLGCPHDYTEFEAELMPLLENIHGETQHCGKLPAQASDSSQQQYKLIRLRKELQSAVASEAYETAAELRDTIESIEVDLDRPKSSENPLDSPP
ncbi:MAG: DNA helicase UvrBC [Planctomycetaceae bacterium]|jgi:protein arginine kinase activator|nr:DNA helicase UvrBC [Planctomycetaceae bacterium]